MEVFLFCYNQTMDASFPLLLNNPAAYAVFKDVVANLPSDCESYIIGGAVRNAMYRIHFHESLKQRDYDQILTKNSNEYIDYLRTLGFVDGGIIKADQIILYKGLVPEPDKTAYDDSVVFDMHPVDGTDALSNLTKHAGLTINGFALSMRDIFDPNWSNKIVALPSAKEDLRNKQIHINRDGYKAEPANIFACIRFISAGFAPPPKEELALLLHELPKLESGRFERNIPKAYKYVGGKAAAHQLVEQLGIKGNLFDENQVKSGKVTI